ncbi:unnamed protein product [Linum tenue]|uniref:Uncharacterized protein n=1 Tax=Linum tenue TaxID=586396 RepID=A0AAV0IE75_9ROSI|nr:unnamed protein product [Linum tenue]
MRWTGMDSLREIDAWAFREIWVCFRCCDIEFFSWVVCQMRLLRSRSSAVR